MSVLAAGRGTRSCRLWAWARSRLRMRLVRLTVHERQNEEEMAERCSSTAFVQQQQQQQQLVLDCLWREAHGGTVSHAATAAATTAAAMTMEAGAVTAAASRTLPALHPLCTQARAVRPGVGGAPGGGRGSSTVMVHASWGTGRRAAAGRPHRACCACSSRSGCRRHTVCSWWRRWSGWRCRGAAGCLLLPLWPRPACQGGSGHAVAQDEQSCGLCPSLVAAGGGVLGGSFGYQQLRVSSRRAGWCCTVVGGCLPPGSGHGAWHWLAISQGLCCYRRAWSRTDEHRCPASSHRRRKALCGVVGRGAGMTRTYKDMNRDAEGFWCDARTLVMGAGCTTSVLTACRAYGNLDQTVLVSTGL